jgi:hypothetical protein
MPVAALALLLVVSPLGPLSKQNSTAEKVASLSRELGIRFAPPDSQTDASQDDALSASGLGAWLNEETERAEDTIFPAPAPVGEYLDAHQNAIAGIIAALEKESPDWGSHPEPKDPEHSALPSSLTATIRLGKVLVAGAMREEQRGHEIEAERALEASWSLARSLPGDTLLGQLMRVAFERWQAGFLRKKKRPSLIWMGRLGTGDPYRTMIDAVDGERWTDPSGLADRYSEAALKGWKAVFEAIRQTSPCELSTLSDADVQRRSSAALGLSFEDRQIVEILSNIAMPNLISAVRRAGRLSVDRELTLHILRLRLARDGSREDRWPAELTDRWSDVCPGVAYVYRTDGISLDIHFDAWVDAGTEHALPLSFHSGKTRFLPTPTRPPTPTPTPTPEDLDSDDPEQDDAAPMSLLRSNGNWWWREATR